MNAFAKLIIKDYLGSLKESDELDFLFPILINLMGYKIISTPKDSKGQSQYGKDIIATGRDSTDGRQKRFYFELKGHSAKNLTSTTFYERDGARESILEAIDAKFEDITISGFNSLPIKIIFVHNGVLQSDFRKTFNDFIEYNFPATQDFKSFERWDIHTLTDLFSEHFFNENLLIDGQSLRLLRRTIVLLDVQDRELSCFRDLISGILNKIDDPKASSRTSEQLFATFNLIILLVFFYSKENDNLEPAIECISCLLLLTWVWILEKNLYEKPYFLNKFKSVFDSAGIVFKDYFEKTLDAAKFRHGLFYESGSIFESIGYPLRCFEYSSKLIFFFLAYNEKTEIRQQKTILKTIIHKNLEGYSRPLIDRNLSNLIYILFFILDQRDCTQDDVKFTLDYLEKIHESLTYTNILRKRFPEVRNNIEALIKFVATNERPYDYDDKSSYLFATIVEILALLSPDNQQAKELYGKYMALIQDKVDLLVFYPDEIKYPVETNLFKKELVGEGYSDFSFIYTNDIEATISHVKMKQSQSNFSLITDSTKFSSLRGLAHQYYGSLYFPSDWRRFFISLTCRES